MKYIYGEFTERQIKEAVHAMHSDIHKLLIHKDNNIIENVFQTEEEYLNYFNNLLFRFAGLSRLFDEPIQLVAFMSTLQAAYDEVVSDQYDWRKFRRAILDCHGYLELMFETEEVLSNA